MKSGSENKIQCYSEGSNAPRVVSVHLVDGQKSNKPDKSNDVALWHV